MHGVPLIVKVPHHDHMRMSISLVILLPLPSILGSIVARLQTNEEILASIRSLIWDIINKLKDYFYSSEEEDDTVEPPPDPNPVAGFGDGPMPESNDSSVQASHANPYHAHGGHPSAVEAWVHRVVKLTRPLLAVFRPSSIRLNVLRVDNWPGTFRVGTSVLKKLAKDRSYKKYLTMLLVGATGGRRKGSAFLGSACYENGFALGMVEDRNNDTETARILAHEIGHTLGIR